MSKRVALVTGGIGGIGSAICEALLAQGRTVVANCHPSEEQDAVKWQAAHKEKGMDMEIFPADVSSFEDASAMVEDIIKRHGSLDIIVNCAGITRDKTLKKMDVGSWTAVISVNLNSVFNVTRPAIDGMLNNGFGRIVNISSVNGQKGQFGQTNYSAAKAGMHGFTMALAQETARKNVMVNTVSPGYIETAMTAAVPEDIRNAIIATIPAARMGQPKEIADAVAFLSSDDNTYITGANLPVNGGLYMG
ncbi:MAG: acetoacetyl-CoA reductase [Chromatiales bacterium]|nr:acetoacetyl-CoA reductase [Chromatiales bacterium]